MTKPPTLADPAGAPSAIEAARRIRVAMESIKSKRLPIKFPDDETAMVFACIIENAGKVSRALIKAHEALEANQLRCARLEGALKQLPYGYAALQNIWRIERDEAETPSLTNPASEDT